MVNTNIQQTDIMIVGAGMVGSLLALAIAKQSPQVKITLIDENAEKTEKGAHPGFDARSIALSAGSCQLLEQLGVWSSLVKDAQPIQDIHISDRSHIGIVDLESSTPESPYGFVVELQNVGVVLKRELSLYSNIERLFESSLTSISKQQSMIIAELQNRHYIEAKLCIAADGGNSKTNLLLGIDSISSDYECSAIIANIRSDKAHQNRAYERFTEAGPLALLPLSEQRYSLVWSVKNSELEQILKLNEQQFLNKLQDAFGFRAGVFTEVGKRDSYPLKLIKTDKPIKHRSIAIGNAAHLLHPVMGQGFNLGMRDLSVLAAIIADLDDINQLGDFSMLSRYWSARKDDHHTTINMTDSIVRIFSSNDWPLIVGRTLALQAISILPSLGKPIVKQAKGQFNLFKNENKKS